MHSQNDLICAQPSGSLRTVTESGGALCWYVIATTDLLIPVGAQRFMAQRAGAGTLEVRASHAIAMTQSAAVAGQIIAAVSAVRKARPDRHGWP